MKRRRFLYTSLAIGLTAGLAGCNTGNDPDETTPTETSTDDPGGQTSTPRGTATDNQTATETEEDEQQTEEDTETAVRYFFDDETGALGELGDEDIPENYDNIVTNTDTESDYEEMQRNDEDHASGWLEGSLGTTAEDFIDRVEVIYNNPEQEFDVPDSYDDIDFSEEDDEITFVRALIKASQEDGVASSPMANIIVNEMAEEALDQIQPGFTDFKISSLLASEPLNPNSDSAEGGAERENEWGQTFVNSGLKHLIGFLQYEKDGEEKVKYAEVTDSLNTNLFRRVIRDPEVSLYRTSLDHENVDNSRDYESGDAGTMFPEHYVTVFDYEKARELESQDILGLGENSDGGINGVGDYMITYMMETVDDMGFTNSTGHGNPDRENLDGAADGKLVSDEFGESIEDYVTDPTVEKREKFRSLARGLYQLFQQEGYHTEVAITGTLEDPEILPTDQSTVNQVRQDEAYDEVRERVTS